MVHKETKEVVKVEVEKVRRRWRRGWKQREQEEMSLLLGTDAIKMDTSTENQIK